jgi:hypothetical protein
MTVSCPITVDTVDFIVWTVGKVSGTQLMFAFDASKTFFVVGSRLRNSFFGVKDHALASWTSGCLSLLTLNSCDVSSIQLWLGLMSIHMGIAEFTINIAIRAFGAQLIIQRPLAVTTSETFLMVQSTFGGHFFSFKNLATTPGTAFFFILSLNLAGISDGLRPFIRCNGFMTHFAVSIAIRGNAQAQSIQGTGAFGASQTFLMVNILLDSHFFGFIDCSTTSWTTLFIGRSNYASVGIDFGSFRRCNFVQADFAVKFVARYPHIVRIQLLGTGNTLETTFMEATSPSWKSLGIIDNFFAIWTNLWIHDGCSMFIVTSRNSNGPALVLQSYRHAL